MDGKLNPEQIKNWRKFAFLLPDDIIQRIRDELQARVDAETKPEPKLKEDKGFNYFQGLKNN
jgi:hypothetical protein